MEIPGYEITRIIGRGGMATAYLALQKSLGREVVLKVLDTSISDRKETVERFLNEGRIIAALRHPNIITIYDIGQSGEQVYISMEFVEGGDLKQRMQRKVFTPDEALDIIEKIASGLAVAHRNGIVHRDVKPGNILFRRDGTPLLSDFGIAKRLGGDPDLTATGMFVGSPNYMAPEQSEAGPIDGRADIYALGVILYEMLSGERAYAADSVIDVILMHKKAPLPRLPAGYEELQELLELMMAKNRRDRFRDVDSLMHYIRELRRKGVVKSTAELTANPDFDITGEHAEVGQNTRSTRVNLQLRPQPWPRIVLFGLLMLCALGWGALLVFERRLAAETDPRPVIAETLETVPGGQPALPSGASAGSPGGELTQVSDALLWLGRHSLDALRLTAPPRDNAYYYFTRLLQLDPDNRAAREGLRQIAVQCAFLAERELAQDRYAEALSYISVGLQIDPNNESLRVLRDLADSPRPGFWQALVKLFD
ncbi:MAG: serine/threonine-protein kinase [Gammaproteobacteria bacterium]